MASKYPEFPVVAEAARECLSDVFDVPALADVLRRIASQEIRLLETSTPVPSPYAASLLLGYVAHYIYDSDLPLAERRAASLAIDPVLLAELLGGSDQISLREVLSCQVIVETEAELQCLAAARQARTGEEITDLVRVLGPLTETELVARCIPELDVPSQVENLIASRRLLPVRYADTDAYADPADAGMLRDGLGVVVDQGLPAAFAEPGADPLGRIIGRYARRRGPFTAAEVSATFGIGVSVARDVLSRLVSGGRLRVGEFRPGGTSEEYLDAGVFQQLRKRSLAALRADIEPVSGQALARFLPTWQQVEPWPAADQAGRAASQVARRSGGFEGLIRAVEQLAGCQLPASALETLVLPARVADYRPAMLDELMMTGEVTWTCHGAIGTDDVWVALHPVELAPLTVPEPEKPTHGLGRDVLDVLAGGGGYFFTELAVAMGPQVSGGELRDTLWELIVSGCIRSDTLAPLRSRIDGGRSAHRAAPRTPRPRLRGFLPSTATFRTPADVAGRFSIVRAEKAESTAYGLALAELLLDRYGVLTRGQVSDVSGGFAGLYPHLAAMEETGRIRRGYFVEGCGAAQFATSGAVDRLRAHTAGVSGRPMVLAATDPANAYGSALGWPEISQIAAGHRPTRRAGAVVVLQDGRCQLYAGPGGRNLLVFTTDLAELAAAATEWAALIRRGVIGSVTVKRINGCHLDQAAAGQVEALRHSGFALTPSGLRIRPDVR